MPFIIASFSQNLHETGQSVLGWLDHHGMNILLIILAAWIIRHFGANIIGRVLTHTVRSDLYPSKSDRQKRIKTLNTLAKAIMRVGVYVVAGILIMGEINPNYTTALFASAGLVTVAIGFGAKNLINDFISGMFIIYENQYRVGDVVEISDVSGVVTDVTIRTTVLRDFDGNVHHVPNGSIVVTTNKTIEFSQLNEDILVAQDSDLSLVERIINHTGEVLDSEPAFTKMIRDAPHFAGVNGYAAGGGISVKITAITSANDKYTVRSELYKRLTKTFRANNISIVSPLPPMLDPASPKKK